MACKTHRQLRMAHTRCFCPWYPRQCFDRFEKGWRSGQCKYLVEDALFSGWCNCIRTWSFLVGGFGSCKMKSKRWEPHWRWDKQHCRSTVSKCQPRWISCVVRAIENLVSIMNRLLPTRRIVNVCEEIVHEAAHFLAKLHNVHEELWKATGERHLAELDDRRNLMNCSTRMVEFWGLELHTVPSTETEAVKMWLYLAYTWK